MNPATKALLRNAIIEAVNGEQDFAAMELLSILASGAPAAQPPQPALPVAREVIDGCARDYHYWVNFIRENFIPFMTANGRHGFTSQELFSWLENNPAVQFTAGEVEQRPDGHQAWRNTISAALSALKQRGILTAPIRGRSYQIEQRSSHWDGELERAQ
jgi:hypothetical protein